MKSKIRVGSILQLVIDGAMKPVRVKDLSKENGVLIECIDEGGARFYLDLEELPNGKIRLKQNTRIVRETVI